MSKEKKVALTDVIIELHVPDFDKVKEFYGKLGFKVIWEREPENFKGYLVMKQGNSILCFWAGNQEVYKHKYFKKYPKSTKKGYGVELVIMVGNVEIFYEKTREFANVVEKLQIRPWGLKDFRIEDPFGFYIRLSTSPAHSAY